MIDIGAKLRQWLAYPVGRGVDIDSPAATVLRRRIIREKGLLHRIYLEWYRDAVASLPSGTEPVLELGSGAGFLRESVPSLITSDILLLPDISVVLDGHALPFRDGALRAIVLINVLHHLGRSSELFHDAGRCVRAGGTLIMIEPWVTPWSRWVYARLHHEPFDPDAEHWEFPSSGPLSGANVALPWILFHRDRQRFESTFPQWRIQSIDLGMPVRYLLSGGVSLRSLVPGRAHGSIKWIEGHLPGGMEKWAMFARIVLVRST